MENSLPKPVVSATYKNAVFKSNLTAASHQPKEKVTKVNSASSQGELDLRGEVLDQSDVMRLPKQSTYLQHNCLPKQM
ncbi:hypothetical protein Q8A67_024683 [Cirrhinus molitorella]|uniref:Uncharacterized protein n=1 Tax=Cirrhinus molitorella TaxID=172907 RepID=A0AA88NYY2_9TELE|nr:hypothetical protein Q8A67_024683 [Cirrhinus molitorella]